MHITAFSQGVFNSLRLCEMGGNPNVQDNDGKTPLHYGIFRFLI